VTDSTVLLFRASRAEGGRDLFSCSVLEWRLLHQLAMTFGWEPLGTTYPLPLHSRITAPALHDYEPGTPSDLKLVEQRDAIEWARALEAGKRSGHLEAMLEAHSGMDGDRLDVRSLASVVDEFTQYAYGGAFSFSLAAAPTSGSSD
jgi:hypothetical protein